MISIAHKYLISAAIIALFAHKAYSGGDEEGESSTPSHAQVLFLKAVREVPLEERGDLADCLNLMRQGIERFEPSESLIEQLNSTSGNTLRRQQVVEHLVSLAQIFEISSYEYSSLFKVLFDLEEHERLPLITSASPAMKIRGVKSALTDTLSLPEEKRHYIPARLAEFVEKIEGHTAKILKAGPVVGKGLMKAIANVPDENWEALSGLILNRSKTLILWQPIDIDEDFDPPNELIPGTELAALIRCLSHVKPEEQDNVVRALEKFVQELDVDIEFYSVFAGMSAEDILAFQPVVDQFVPGLEEKVKKKFLKTAPFHELCEKHFLQTSFHELARALKEIPAPKRFKTLSNIAPRLSGIKYGMPRVRVFNGLSRLPFHEQIPTLQSTSKLLEKLEKNHDHVICCLGTVPLDERGKISELSLMCLEGNFYSRDGLFFSRVVDYIVEHYAIDGYSEVKKELIETDCWRRLAQRGSEAGPSS